MKRKHTKHTLTLVDAEPRYKMKFMMNYTPTDDETTADIMMNDHASLLNKSKLCFNQQKIVNEAATQKETFLVVAIGCSF